MINGSIQCSSCTRAKLDRTQIHTNTRLLIVLYNPSSDRTVSSAIPTTDSTRSLSPSCAQATPARPTRASSPSTRTTSTGSCGCISTGPKWASRNQAILRCHGPTRAFAWTCADVTANTRQSPLKPLSKRNLRLTDAGLLSTPANKATVASAIMSLAALDVHSSVTSCLPVCFTSTAFITLRTISLHPRYSQEYTPGLSSLDLCPPVHRCAQTYLRDASAPTPKRHPSPASVSASRQGPTAP